MENSGSGFKKFLLLWAGELISSIGGGLTSFGLAVYVFNETGSAASMAVVSLLAFLPTLILSAPAGVLADRYDRRLLMMIGDGLPGLYVVPFTSSYKINVFRIPLIPETVDSFADDGLKLVSTCLKRYHGHFNLDYSLKIADNQITVAYMGYGKLDDSSLETIDEVKTYPLFSFEDRSDGQWIPTEHPWEEGIEPLFQDPDQVVDPFYSDT